MFDAEHFFDGFKEDGEYTLRLPRGGACGRRALDRALRHQWRDAAARGRGDRRRGCVRSHPGRAARHPHPQRHRERGRQQPGRDPRRGAAGAGHAERAGRALRQRQPGQPDPDAEAQAGLRGRRQRRRPAPPDPALAHLRRAAQPHAEPARAPMSAPRPSPTRRACTPRRWRRARTSTSTSTRRWSATRATSWSPTRPAAPTCCSASPRWGSTSIRTPSRRPSC